MQYYDAFDVSRNFVQSVSKLLIIFRFEIETFYVFERKV